ncbi:hypothetical protein BD779DRAFT_1472254 [Infundibulicybe gibba]|nr:hypothetical protein BD779DRAFT_1472254 [Infundibulicybe gibba]
MCDRGSDVGNPTPNYQLHCIRHPLTVMAREPGSGGTYSGGAGQRSEGQPALDVIFRGTSAGLVSQDGTPTQAANRPSARETITAKKQDGMSFSDLLCLVGHKTGWPLTSENLTNQLRHQLSRSHTNILLTHNIMDSFTYTIASVEDISTSAPANEENGGNGGYAYCVVA